jgi:hypothetical protein
MRSQLPRHPWKLWAVVGLFTIGWALAPARGWAWGRQGHRVVGEVAEHLLTSGTQNEITLLAGGSVHLADLATCADEIRAHERNHTALLSPACAAVFPNPPTGTSSWHFVNVEISPTTPAEPTDISKAIDAACQGSCITVEITRFAEVLGDTDRNSSERVQALAFLVHFVGDVHQPLHATDRDHDEGGNKVLVHFFDLTHEKLHAIWDTDLLEHIAGDEQTLFGALGDEIQRARKEGLRRPGGTTISEWVAGLLPQWVGESVQLAKQVAYDGVPEQLKPVQLASEYDRKAEAVVKTRLAQAGVRLAALINAALDGPK